MGILRDDVFSATSLLDAVRLLISLMMTESKEAKSYKLMFIGIRGAHFRWPSRGRVFVELLPERKRSGRCRL